LKEIKKQRGISGRAFLKNRNHLGSDLPGSLYLSFITIKRKTVPEFMAGRCWK
jgi:hypothetical protein